MKQLVITVALIVVVGVINAEPARLRSNKFFARQQAEAVPPNGLYNPAPAPTSSTPPKPSGGGYHYEKPEYGLPEPEYGPPTYSPTTTAEPELPEEPTNVYLPGSQSSPDNGDADIDQPTEDVDAEAVAGGDENDVEGSQADQLRQYKQARRLIRPLKLVDARNGQQFQRLVYYPVSARLQAQPVVTADTVPVAYALPGNGFAYSLYHQQNW